LMQKMIQRIGLIPPEVLEAAPNLTAWKNTGPAFLTDTVKNSTYNKLRIYPSHYFIPKHYSGLETQFKDNIYSEQFWGSTETLQGKMGMTYGN